MSNIDSLFIAIRPSRTLLGAVVIGLAITTGASAQALDTYAILGGSTITNTGVTTVTGNIGLSPGTSAPGVAAIVLTGTLHIGDGPAAQAKADLNAAYNILMSKVTTVDLTSQTLGVGGAQTLTKGVYSFSSSALLNGTLTLDGGPDDVFIFKIGTTLTTTSGSQILLTGGAKASNVFFVVGDSATLAGGTAFKGQILAMQSITLVTAATINCGAAWAQNGAVTLDTNTIGICSFAVAAGTFGDVLGGNTTTNQQAVIDAINAFIAAGGTLPLAFDVLALLSPTELAAALGELSGETATATAPAGNQAMDSLLDTILGGGGRTVLDYETGAPVADNGPDSNTVSVMGYTDDPRRSSALDSVDMATAGRTPDVGKWTIWGAGFGGMSSVAGDVSAGTHSVMTQDFGYTIGFERHVSADTMFGFAVAGGGTNFNLDDSLGSGRSAMLEAAAYAKANFGQSYLSGVIAYGFHDVTTDRYLDIGGGAHYQAEFGGQDVAAAVEAGYDTGWFTPYVGGRIQGYLTPNYSERTISGSDMFALDYAQNLDLVARSEIGVKLDATSNFDGGRLSVHGALAWAHTFWGDSSATASFQALPGSSFTVDGAMPAADLLLVSGGVGADFDNGFSLDGTLGANLALNARSFKASARLGYNF